MLKYVSPKNTRFQVFHSHSQTRPGFRQSSAHLPPFVSGDRHYDDEKYGDGPIDYDCDDNNDDDRLMKSKFKVQICYSRVRGHIGPLSGSILHCSQIQQLLRSRKLRCYQ